MEQVTQTALTGFRSPTEEEIERIRQYVKKELSRQRRIQGFWMFFCGVIAFSMLLPPFLLWNPMETPAIIANLLIGIPTALGAIAIGKSYKRKKQWIRQICAGAFQMLGCWIYETQFGSDLPGLAWMKIYNSQNQYCTERMLIDYWAAEYYQRGQRNKLLLARCGDDYFELFSDTKLGIQRA